MFDLAAVQSAIRSQKVDGWLLYDFRGINVLAQRVVGLRREEALAPLVLLRPRDGRAAKARPRASSPRPSTPCPASRRPSIAAGRNWRPESVRSSRGRSASRWSTRRETATPTSAASMPGPSSWCAPSAWRSSSSGDLVQQFEATWDDEQEASHFAAAKVTDAAYGVAWAFIARSRQGRRPDDRARRPEAHHGPLRGQRLHDYSPPIVGVGPHSGDPHYEPTPQGNAAIRAGDFVLIDLWASSTSREPSTAT